MSVTFRPTFIPETDYIGFRAECDCGEATSPMRPTTAAAEIDMLTDPPVCGDPDCAAYGRVRVTPVDADIPTFNACTGNFAAIRRTFSLTSEGDMNPAELAVVVAAYLATNHSDPGSDPVHFDEDNGPRWHDFGRPAGYMEYAAKRILTVCDAATRMGRNVVWY